MDAKSKLVKNSGAKFASWRWGFVIVFGKITTMFLDAGIAKSFGVLIPEMSYQMDENYATVGLICSFPGTFMYLFCPVITVILERANHRLVAVIGGTMSGLSLVILAFFTDTLVAGVCLSFTGIGLACVNLPLSLVIKYIYPQKFLLVSIVAMYGYTAGTMVLPFITERSLEAYGYSGTFLILGGIALNTVVCAVSIRRPILKESPKAHYQDQRVRPDPTEVQASNKSKKAAGKVILGPVKICNRHKKSQSSGCFYAAKLEMVTCTASRKECMSGQDVEEEVGSMDKVPLIDSEARVDHHPNTTPDINEEPPEASPGQDKSDWRTLLFKEPLLWFNLLTIFLMGYVIYSWMLFLVPHAEQLGIPQSRAVFLSSIAGIGGIVGRTTFIGLAANGVNAFYIYIGAGIVNTISFLIDFSGSEYSIRAALAFFQGVSFFAEDTLFYAIPDKTLVDQKNFNHAFALCSLCYGIGASSAGYVTGYLIDITHSYTKVFVFNGIVHTIIVVMVIITTVCLRKRQIQSNDGRD